MLNNALPANGDAMVLQCKDSSNFKPHPPGIYPALCVDVIDLGLQWSEFQGQRELKRKLKLVFETEHVGEDGKRGIVTSKKFNASMHPKSHLAEFVGKWRGRPLVPGENVDLNKLPGASCTLVLSHQLGKSSGKIYAAIDAVSQPTKKVQPSGTYDGVAMRQRVAEWVAKEVAQAVPAPYAAAPVSATPANVPHPSPPPQHGAHGVTRPTSSQPAPAAAPTPTPVTAPTAEYDDVPF
jgi:hypothetical protein